jgi:phosphoglycerate mutase family protein
MTIGTIVYLINGMQSHGLDNGSVTLLEYENGQFTVKVVGDRSYREIGRAKLEEVDRSEQ